VQGTAQDVTFDRVGEERQTISGPSLPLRMTAFWTLRAVCDCVRDSLSTFVILPLSLAA
jgi:hypothetical protein